MTGNIHPKDIDIIFKTLLEADLVLGFGTIQSLKQEKGISMSVILKELTIKLMEADMPPSMKKFIVKRMAELEYRSSLNSSEKIMLGSLVAAFVEARRLV